MRHDQVHKARATGESPPLLPLPLISHQQSPPDGAEAQGKAGGAEVVDAGAEVGALGEAHPIAEADGGEVAWPSGSHRAAGLSRRTAGEGGWDQARQVLPLDRVLLHSFVDRWMPTCCSMAVARAAAMEAAKTALPV